MMESRIYKVLAMDSKPGAKQTTTIYVLASSAEEAEKRAMDVMGLMGGPSWKFIAMEYLVDRTVNWVAITGFDGVVSEG